LRSAVGMLLVGLILWTFVGASQTSELQQTVSCQVQAFFVSPSVDGVIKRVLLALIDEASTTIDVALYSFTDNDLGDALVAAYRRGVQVRIILDDGQEEARGGEYIKLTDAGMCVYVEHVEGLMHHKFMVIDGRLVVTGSYNWSAAADDSNFENIVVLECPELASVFTQEFERICTLVGCECGGPPPPPPPSCPFAIYRVDPVAEVIAVQNMSSSPQDLGGWVISDGEGSYMFPYGTIVQPGEVFEVGIDTYNPSGYTRGLYLNNRSDEVFLYTPTGKLCDMKSW